MRLLAGSEDAVAAWDQRTAEVGLRKPRRDAVPALEIVMSASPEWFAHASANEREAWASRSLDWASDLVGRKNVLQAILHDDEETPHLHVLAVPLTLKERKRAGRPRKGRKPPTKLAYGLAAADIVGSREQLREHQTRYAAAVSGLGIRRGLPKRLTGAQHRSAAAYRAEASELVSDADDRAAAFSAGLDALEAGELVWRQADAQKRERLERAEVPTPTLPKSPQGWAAWRHAVRPYTASLLAYGRRLAGLAQREQELADENEALRRVASRQAAQERDKAGPAFQDVRELQKARQRRAQRGLER